jgi:predicted RNA polymerase sigma factor
MACVTPMTPNTFVSNTGRNSWRDAALNYALQAAIAACHTRVRTAEETA